MEKHEKNQKLPNQKQAKNGSAAEPKSALFTEDRLQGKRVWMEKPNPDTTPTLLKAEHTHTPTLQCKEGGHREYNRFRMYATVATQPSTIFTGDIN